jgi:multiple sugar transport system substrate-binding protein
LYYDERVLEEFGLKPPRALDELDAIARRIVPAADGSPPRDSRRTAATAEPNRREQNSDRYGFLPDPRRIWAWGIVFGGRFYDPANGQITSDSEPILRACQWMASYGERFGYENVTRYRKADQALPGSAFPLLEKRYAAVMDGQWRVAEVAAAIDSARRHGEAEPRIGVVPLPPPPGGVAGGGWVNGNFFVVPRGGHNPQGAWQFMKFWSGAGGHAAEAALACAAGGWIPAGQEVVDQPVFQEYLRRHPLFRTFVDLAASPHQVPTPPIPGAQYFQDEISRAAEDAMAGRLTPRAALEDATRRVRARLAELSRDLP